MDRWKHDHVSNGQLSTNRHIRVNGPSTLGFIYALLPLPEIRAGAVYPSMVPAFKRVAIRSATRYTVVVFKFPLPRSFRPEFKYATSE